MTFRTRFARFVERHLIATDPHPEYSRLDRWDGRGTVPLTAEDES